MKAPHQTQFDINQTIELTLIENGDIKTALKDCIKAVEDYGLWIDLNINGLILEISEDSTLEDLYQEYLDHTNYKK